MVAHILAQGNTSAWSYGGAVLTLLFPVLLFMLVAAWLFVVYNRPQRIPGSPRRERSAGHTWPVKAVGEPAGQGTGGSGAESASSE